MKKFLITYSRVRDTQFFDYECAQDMIDQIIEETDCTNEQAKEILEEEIDNWNSNTEPSWNDFKEAPPVVWGIEEAHTAEEAIKKLCVNKFMKKQMKAYELSPGQEV